MFEKYNLEQGEEESTIIRKTAQRKKLERNEKEEPSGKDYEDAERELMLKNRTLANVLAIGEEHLIPETKEQLKNIIELPLLSACEELYEKNINTLASSANQQDIERGEVYILIDFDTLSDENKKISLNYAESKQDDGHWGGGKTVRITIPVSESSTLNKISLKALEIVRAFRKQPATWIPTYKKLPIKLEDIRDIFYGPKDPEYDDPTASGWQRNGLNYDPEKKVFYDSKFKELYYDKNEDIYYLSEEHYRKASEKIETA